MCTPAIDTPSSTAVHQLVCIGPTDRLSVPPTARRIDNGDLSAMVISVDPTDFTGPSGERNLADVVWLSVRAGEHERLIEQAGTAPDDQPAHTGPPVLPARFGTLFATDESVRSMLARHQTTIREFLALIEQRDEWTIKITADSAAATRALTIQLAHERGIDAGSPGAKYLLMKRIEQEAALQAAAFIAQQSAAVLSGFSRSSIQHRLGRPGKRLDDGTEVVASAAFLIDRSSQNAFIAACDAACTSAASQGLSITRTGPWPAYSFAPSLGD